MSTFLHLLSFLIQLFASAVKPHRELKTNNPTNPPKSSLFHRDNQESNCLLVNVERTKSTEEKTAIMNVHFVQVSILIEILQSFRNMHVKLTRYLFLKWENRHIQKRPENKESIPDSINTQVVSTKLPENFPMLFQAIFVWNAKDVYIKSSKLDGIPYNKLTSTWI